MKSVIVKFKSKGAYSQGKYVTVEMKDKESKAEVRRLDKKARAQATFGRGPVSAVRSTTRKKAKKRGSRKS